MPAYNVKLLGIAEKDIDEICEYLSQFYPGTPGKFLDSLDKDFENVNLNPYMYPVYEYNKKYRRIVTNDYLVFYTIDEENNLVRIYRILNGKQDVKTILEKLQ